MSSCENSDSPEELHPEVSETERRELGCAALPPDIARQHASDTRFTEKHRSFGDDPEDTDSAEEVESGDSPDDTSEDDADASPDSSEASDDAQKKAEKSEASPKALKEFEDCYRGDYGKIRGYLINQGVSDPDALTQDAFREVFGRLSHYETDTNMLAWVMSYARGRMLDQARNTRRHPVDADPDIGTIYAKTQDAAPSAEAEALALSLEERLDTLPESQLSPLFKGILLAVYRDGKQLKKYAQEIGANENTIRGYHARALRAVEKLAGAQSDMDEREKRGIVADFLGLQD